MRIKFEKEILDQPTRKKLIEEIESSENRWRKAEAYKRYQCYKDKTSDYVVDALLKQFDETTVLEMRYGVSNISIVRKVNDKLSRVYSNGAERTIEGDDKATENLQTLAQVTNLQTEMKKTNRFLKLQKNAALYIKPCPVYSESGAVEKWTIKPQCLQPYLYDVVEDFNDREKPLVFILSSYKPEFLPAGMLEFGGSNNLRTAGALTTTTTGNNKDEKIADVAADQNAGEKKQYIFWSKNHHFTCDEQGAIVVNEGNKDNKNPFEVCPIINFAIDQDGAFWAEGGKDLIDGAVLINALISHTNHVGVVQGYGQFYATGENLPRTIKVGPTKAIIAEYKKDEQAKPEFGFLNANPDLDSMRGLIEMYLALLLTTNNLSTTGVSTQLSGSNSLASGVALILDKAESLEDVQDQRQIFVDKEPDIFEAINAQIKVYGAQMDEELKGLQLPDDFKKKFSIKFGDQQAIMTEKEKLDNMKARQDLGLDTMISLIMKDDPTLTKAQAESKMKDLLEDRIKQKMLEQELMAAAGVEVGDNPDDPNNPEEGDPNAVDENGKDPKEPKDPKEDDPKEEDPKVA